MKDEMKSAMASMQLKHFMIQATGDEAAEEALNRFLRGHQVLEVRQEFVANGAYSAWYVAVRSAHTQETRAAAGSKRAAVDYKEILDPETFDRFAELRRRRKAIAEAEGIPVFAVFSNEELAGIAGLENPAPQDLRAIKGIGVKKVERFGARILTPANENDDHETSETTV